MKNWNLMKKFLFFLLFFIFVLAYNLNFTIYDFDLWARLNLGEYILTNLSVPMQDFLSYTPTHTWFDHEWGCGVIFYWVLKHFSSVGLIVLQSFIIFTMFFVISKTVELRGVKSTTPFNFIFYFLAFHAMNTAFETTIRAQIITFLFFALFLYVLEYCRLKNKAKPLIALPLLMIIWNNLHGGCISGIGLIFLYVIGELLEGRSVRKYLITFLSTILVLPINPYGFEYLGFLFKANTMDRTYVVEWRSLISKGNFLRYLKFKFFALGILFVEFFKVSMNISLKKFDKTKFLFLLVTFCLAIKSIKLLPFFVIVATVFCYDDFYTLFNKFMVNVRKVLGIKSAIIVKTIVYLKESIIWIAVFTLFLSSLYAKNFINKVNLDYYPVKEVEFLKINGFKGKILSDMGLGSYISYKLYPDFLVFMDGRYEVVYFDFMIPLLKQFMLAENNWNEIFNQGVPDAIIVTKIYPISNFLRTQSDWLEVSESKRFRLFINNKLKKDKYIIPTSDGKYYQRTLFDRK